MIRLASYRVPRKPAGVVLYEGPSVLDGARIVCIATFTLRQREDWRHGPNLDHPRRSLGHCGYQCRCR